jgi:hypothetical protein
LGNISKELFIFGKACCIKIGVRRYKFQGMILWPWERARWKRDNQRLLCREVQHLLITQRDFNTDS